jgi:hypothetical protein
MFKKSSSIKISGKWKYYPQRNVEIEPITIEDQMSVMGLSQESGSEYLKKHLQLINSSMDRFFIEKLMEQMADEASNIYEIYESFPMKVDFEKISVFLCYGYCFAMTENLFDIARRGLISGACRDAMREFAMLDAMENPGETELVLHCLFRGFEICRDRVPAETD